MKRTTICIAILVSILGVLAIPVTALSQERAGAVTVSPMGGVHVFDSRQDIEQDATGGVGIGYNITKHWGAEVQFQGGQFEQEYFDCETCACTEEELNAYVMHLDALYHFRPDKRLVPYLSAGVGGVHLEGDHFDDDTYGIVNYGAGVKYYITDNVALRGEARHMYDWEDSNNNVAATVGLTFQFGGKKEPLEKPAPPPQEEEAPPPAPTLGVVVEERPPETEVGPVDVQDFEPAPLADDEKLAIDLKLLFDFDKAIIKPPYYDNLNKIGAFMRDFPETHGVIEGHTDEVGTPSYNLKLSWRRAESVRQYLIKNFGIAPERLEARGYGESLPVAENETDVGRQKNRRVILVVTNGNGGEKARIFRERYNPSYTPGSTGAAPSPRTAPNPSGSPQSKAPAGTSSGQTLRDVQVDTSGDQETVMLVASGPVAAYNAFILENPNRLVIDLPGKWRKPGASPITVDRGNVRQVRFGSYPDKLRVVLDLKEKPAGEPQVQTGPQGLRISMKKAGQVNLSQR